MAKRKSVVKKKPIPGEDDWDDLIVKRSLKRKSKRTPGVGNRLSKVAKRKKISKKKIAAKKTVRRVVKKKATRKKANKVRRKKLAVKKFR